MGPRHELQKVWSAIGISHKVEEFWKYPCPILAGTKKNHVWKITASLHSIAYDCIALLLVSCVQISSVFIRSPLIFRCLLEMPPCLLSQEKSDSAWFLPYEHPTIVDIQYVCSIERMVASAMFFKAHDAGRLSCCSWWWSSCDIMEVIGRHHPCLATTTHDNLYDLSHLVCYYQKKGCTSNHNNLVSPAGSYLAIETRPRIFVIFKALIVGYGPLKICRGIKPPKATTIGRGEKRLCEAGKGNGKKWQKKWEKHW